MGWQNWTQLSNFHLYFTWWFTEIISPFPFKSIFGVFFLSFFFFWHISPPSFQIASFPIKTTFHSANICSQVVTFEQWTAESEFSNSEKETPDYKFIGPSCFLHALSENNKKKKIVTPLK